LFSEISNKSQITQQITQVFNSAGPSKTHAALIKKRKWSEIKVDFKEEGDRKM